MSGRGDIITVDVERSIHRRIVKKAESRNMSIRKYVNKVLLMNLEKEEFASSYAPFLELIGANDGRLTVRDNKRDRVTEVIFKKSRLFCTLDKSFNCTHIHFALVLPEIGRLGGQ